MNNKNKRGNLKKICVLSLIFTFALSVNAKDKQRVIMTVDGENVPTEEFVYLYQKNKEQQMTPQTLDEYLQLFEVYRLKVAEAKSNGVDTLTSFKEEMDMYRHELVEPYLRDTVFFNTLVEEAFDRENIQMQGSHIMIIRTGNTQRDKKYYNLLDSVRKEILNGADFAEMARQYSQDQFSSGKGGDLGFTPAGTFPYAFETAMYETPIGEVSEIVESHVGWHLVKPTASRPAMDFHHPAKTYDEVRKEVERKSSSLLDIRNQQIKNHNLAMLKARHGNVDVSGLSDDGAFDLLTKAEEQFQYDNNPEYRNLMYEYLNGSLLYEVSVENIWNKAPNDTDGLKKFFAENQEKYKWDAPHAKGVLIQASNDSIASDIQENIKGMDSDSIVAFINDNYNNTAIVENINLIQGQNEIIDKLIFGIDTQVNPNSEFPVYFVVNAVLEEIPEDFEEVKTLVINDYQEYLEKEWVKDLRNKHVVKINKKELSKLRKELKE